MNRLKTGIKYQLLNERRRGRIFPYQSSNAPSPRFLNNSLHREDLNGMTTKEIAKHIIKDRERGYVSRITVGFEVEKLGFARECIDNAELFTRVDSVVKETIFFNKLERDSSCETEGVSNILPLIPRGRWRNKVFSLMKDAESLIDDRYSPSDRTCGGHTTIGVVGMSGTELNKRVRLFSGFVMSLYRKRLSNNYCNHNLRMNVDTPFQFQPPRQYQRWINREEQMRRVESYHQKYQFCLIKPSRRGQRDLIEFRVVPRFKSVKEMIRRYEFFYELINHVIDDNNIENRSFAKLWKKLKPIVSRMFPNDEQRVREVYIDAKHFQKFIDTGEISSRVRKWLVPLQQEWAERIGIDVTS